MPQKNNMDKNNKPLMYVHDGQTVLVSNTFHTSDYTHIINSVPDHIKFDKNKEVTITKEEFDKAVKDIINNNKF